ncbi:hypothetical protein [Salinibacterium sp. SWN248]|uniref:hypothetical protein n=1 Tax=Salinibacterium sp. SWN248 TaxID=2792056 RepID=UPI0018CF6AD4|nr:hypothetical protein [Salinibacterium sp. SWN248]MBH0024759.1 hypothetical protein [Salinibacterium sp. SWN248]
MAMKLRANRPGPDTRDIRLLVSLCAISSLDDADELHEEFCPCDSLYPRAVSMVTAILADGKSDTPVRPKPINF